MPTTAKALKLFTVVFELVGDECEDAEPWKIYTPDGDFETCRETEAEAIARCKECNEELAADIEAEEEAEREELVAALQGRLEEMTFAELRKLAKKWEVI